MTRAARNKKTNRQQQVAELEARGFVRTIYRSQSHILQAWGFEVVRVTHVGTYARAELVSLARISVGAIQLWAEHVKRDIAVAHAFEAAARLGGRMAIVRLARELEQEWRPASKTGDSGQG